MSLGRLRKQVARELRQNPKKAVVLALMCVVALYYWVPILRRWTTPEQDPAANPAIAAVPAPGATATSNRTPHVRWEAVAATIDSSPFMQPARWQLDRDPFGNRTAEPRPPEQREAQVEETLTPEQVGLQLQSTVVGRARQTAVINGQAYVTGDLVQAADDESIAFRIKRVDSDRVILERNGNLFELRLFPDEADGSVAPWPADAPPEAMDSN